MVPQWEKDKVGGGEGAGLSWNPSPCYMVSFASADGRRDRSFPVWLSGLRVGTASNKFGGHESPRNSDVHQRVPPIKLKVMEFPVLCARRISWMR